jgi:uncharacterized protein (TIGR02246 family)
MMNVKPTFFKSLAGLILLAAIPVAGHADNHKRVIEACTNLVLDYAYFRDRPDAEGVADLFTEDAQLTVLGQTFAGRAAIAERIRDAADGPVFRHMMSTIRIFPDDETYAHGVSYVAVYTAPAGQLPGPLHQPAAVGEYHDRFVLTESGWKIARREFIAVFVAEAPRG